MYITVILTGALWVVDITHAPCGGMGPPHHLGGFWEEHCVRNSTEHE